MDMLGTNKASMSICVKNLPTFADDLWLYRRFGQFGAIYSVRAMIQEDTQQCQGLGFINFVNYLDAQAAIAHMNGAFFDGKRLVVEMQRARRKTTAVRAVRGPSVNIGYEELPPMPLADGNGNGNGNDAAAI